jgi:hypothetical protein
MFLIRRLPCVVGECFSSASEQSDVPWNYLGLFVEGLSQELSANNNKA